MSSIRVYPLHDPATISDFLSKHGFNLGPLTREGFFVTSLHEEGRGSIDTRSDLERIQAEPKISPLFEFRLEDIPKDSE